MAQAAKKSSKTSIFMQGGCLYALFGETLLELAGSKVVGDEVDKIAKNVKKSGKMLVNVERKMYFCTVKIDKCHFGRCRGHLSEVTDGSKNGDDMRFLFFDFDYVQMWAQCGTRMVVAPCLGGSASCQSGSECQRSSIGQQGTSDSLHYRLS